MHTCLYCQICVSIQRGVKRQFSKSSNCLEMRYGNVFWGMCDEMDWLEKHKLIYGLHTQESSGEQIVLSARIKGGPFLVSGIVGFRVILSSVWINCAKMTVECLCSIIVTPHQVFCPMNNYNRVWMFFREQIVQSTRIKGGPFLVSGIVGFRVIVSSVWINHAKMTVECLHRFSFRETPYQVLCLMKKKVSFFGGGGGIALN